MSPPFQLGGRDTFLETGEKPSWPKQVEAVQAKQEEKREKRTKSSENTGTAKPNSKGLIPVIELPARQTSIKSSGSLSKRVSWVEPELDEEPLPILDRREPAYARRAPIEDPAALGEIEKELLDLELPISLRSLASISPNMREALRRLFTKKRVPREEIEKMSPGYRRIATYVESVHPEEFEKYQQMLVWYSQEEEAVTTQNVLQHNPIFGDELPSASSYVAHDVDCVPDGSVVMVDPVEIYYSELADDEKPRPIVVSRESLPLRCIYPEINGAGPEECLLDGGSQICSINEESARMLNLQWDPKLVIFLQSANASTEKTLGLARNVPLRINGVVAYLQLHVVPKTAYKVLLGRPFDVLLSTTIHNKRNGDQMLTIEDPNTGRALTLPTFARGHIPPNVRERMQSDSREHLFRASRS